MGFRVDGACTSPIDRGALRCGQASRTQTTSFPEARYRTSGSPHSRVEKTSSTPSCSEYAAAYLPAGKVSIIHLVSRWLKRYPHHVLLNVASDSSKLSCGAAAGTELRSGATIPVTARSICGAHQVCGNLPERRLSLEHQQRHCAPFDRRSWAVQRLHTSPWQLVGRAQHTDLNEHAKLAAGHGAEINCQP